MNATLAITCNTCSLKPGEGACPFIPVELAPSEVLLSQGEHPESVYFIKEGVAVLSSVDAGGVERQLAIRGSGALLGMEALARTACRSEIRALGGLKLCALQARQFARMVGPEGSPARAVLSLVVAALEQQREDIGRQQGPAVDRVARFLLSRGVQTSGGRELPKQLVARLLGMRPETLSRSLRRLSRGAPRRKV